MEKYDNYIIIPMRSGSTGLKNKNIKYFSNLPLFYWTMTKIDSLIKTGRCKKVVVSSDSEWYLDIVKAQFGIVLNECIIYSKRPDYLANGVATTDEVCLYELDKHDINSGIVSILEVTSPLIPTDAFYDMIDSIDDFTDSSFIVYRDIGQFWKCDKSNNFEWERQYKNRRMRQEEEHPLYREVGAWCTKISKFRDTKDRISGQVNSIIIDKNYGISINDEADFYLAEYLMKENAARIFRDRGLYE